MDVNMKLSNISRCIYVYVFSVIKAIACRREGRLLMRNVEMVMYVVLLRNHRR